MCDIYRNTVSNLQVLLYLRIIKLQGCHFLPYQIPQFSRIWDHFHVLCKFQSCEQANVTIQYKTFVVKLLRFILHVYFHVMLAFIAQICLWQASHTQKLTKTFYSDNPVLASVCKACCN